MRDQTLSDNLEEFATVVSTSRSIAGIVSRTEFLLEEDGGPRAHDAAGRKECNPIPQNVGLFHIVGGQQYGPAFSQFL